MLNIRFRQKMPGEWVCIIDETGLSPIAKSILEGFETHIGELFGRVLGVHGIAADDWLRQAGLLDEIGKRLRADEPPPTATETDFLPTLIYPLDCAYWTSMAALDLLDEDITSAIRLHSLSVADLAKFEVNLIWLESLANSDVDCSGVKIDPAVIGALGAQVRWEPRNKTMEYAIRRYDERKWKSVRDAKNKLLDDVTAKAKEFSMPISAGNFPDTLYKWLLAHNKKLVPGS